MGYALRWTTSTLFSLFIDSTFCDFETKNWMRNLSIDEGQCKGLFAKNIIEPVLTFLIFIQQSAKPISKPASLENLLKAKTVRNDVLGTTQNDKVIIIELSTKYLFLDESKSCFS